jgi:hypothetical protein
MEEPFQLSFVTDKSIIANSIKPDKQEELNN